MDPYHSAIVFTVQVLTIILYKSRIEIFEACDLSDQKVSSVIFFIC